MIRVRSTLQTNKQHARTVFEPSAMPTAESSVPRSLGNLSLGSDTMVAQVFPILLRADRRQPFSDTNF